MIWGVFPHQPGVSFETHLWGGGLGAVCAVLLRNYDPSPIPKRYSWEDEDEDDAYIGNAWHEIDDGDNKSVNNDKAE
jgi:hypothetical protein